MREQVLDKELSQLKKLCSEYYEQGKTPAITLIFVNKRVRQRFFMMDGDDIRNPPQGTLVDHDFVEQAEPKDGKFDFFVVPHNVTQGAAKPTHFYVAVNDLNLNKNTVLEFTNALCYNYPNWNDAIKVPAPCMLADRIAIYRTEVGSIPKNLDLLKLPFFL
jgi:aubergine-like protein